VSDINSVWRSHTYKTILVGVITCWLYRFVKIMRTVGHLCDFDLVLGIDITKDDEWVLPGSTGIPVLFHILLHQLMIPITYSLAKIRTLKWGFTCLIRDQ
jgi:hypothetical protein